MNKYLLNLVFLLIFGFSTNAQLYTIIPSDSVSITETVTNSNDGIDLYAYVRNDSSADLTFKWRVGTNTTPPEWFVTFCDNTNCLDISLASESTFFLPAGDTSELKMSYLPELVSGSSDITLSLSVQGVPNSTTTIKYKSDVTANPVSSVINIDSETINLSPNPANNHIQVGGIENAADVQSLEVYSIIGKKILHKEIENINDLRVDVNDLELGVYLVKLFDRSTNVFYTKTFVKK